MMKRAVQFFSVLLLLLIFTIPAQSQQFKGGVIGGLTASQIDGDGFAGFDKAGLLLGGFVNTPLKEDVMFLQFEMVYIEKGSVQPMDPENGVFTYIKHDLAYVELPLLFKYKLKKFIFESGLSYGRLVRYRQFNEQGEHEPFLQFKKYEFAGSLGVNYHFSEKWSSNVRVIRSLLPVSNSLKFDPVRFGFFGGSYNTAIAMSLRYQFLK